MTDSIPSKHKDLLNALCEMQESPAYASRKAVLQEAELTIYRQEQQLLSPPTIVAPGMALVPLHPSEDLIRAFTKAFNEDGFQSAWTIAVTGKVPPDKLPKGWKGRGRIKNGTHVWHDFAAFLWPGCKPPMDEYPPDSAYQYKAKDADQVFDVTWDGKSWECERHGYGELGAYGNGSIAVFNFDGIDIIEEKAT